MLLKMILRFLVCSPYLTDVVSSIPCVHPRQLLYLHTQLSVNPCSVCNACAYLLWAWINCPYPRKYPGHFSPFITSHSWTLLMQLLNYSWLVFFLAWIHSRSVVTAHCCIDQEYVKVLMKAFIEYTGDRRHARYLIAKRGWLVGWLVGWSIGWLISWLVCCLADWLVDYLVR